MRGYIAPISFGALLGVLAIATIVGVGVSVVLHRTNLIPIVIGAVLAVGFAYIVITVSPDEAAPTAPPTPPENRPTAPESGATPTAAGGTIAGPASAPTAPVDPVDLEPDYDPVADADQLDSRRPPSGSGGEQPQ